MGMPDDHIEQELLAAAPQDRAALGQLLLRHYDVLSRHVASRLSASLQGLVSVEDVLQETFIHAFRDIGKFSPLSQQSFAAWLKAIADNRLRDTVKTCKRKKRGGDFHRVRRPDDEQASSVADLVEVLALDSDTPSRWASRGEAVQAVQVAVAGLPDDHRRAISLYCLEGRRVEEIATAMGRSPGAVRGLIRRGTEKMRVDLASSSRYLSKK
jgi:RNA polymerase sigma-70 factor, ECF subfamily